MDLAFEANSYQFDLILKVGNEQVQGTNNVMQAEATRDALAKGLYSRLFDYIVKKVNNAFEIRRGVSEMKKLGILDIYFYYHSSIVTSLIVMNSHSEKAEYCIYVY